jgi:hypothetical protein
MFLDLAELSGKQLQLLKELVPKLSRVAVLGDPAVNASQLSALSVVGRSLAVQVQVLELKSSEPGVGGSIPSQPTIHFKQLPTREFLPI